MGTQRQYKANESWCIIENNHNKIERCKVSFNRHLEVKSSLTYQLFVFLQDVSMRIRQMLSQIETSYMCI